MKLYCGIDLHSNNSLASIINESDEIVFEKRFPNDLGTIRRALQFVGRVERGETRQIGGFRCALSTLRLRSSP